MSATADQLEIKAMTYGLTLKQGANDAAVPTDTTIQGKGMFLGSGESLDIGLLLSGTGAFSSTAKITKIDFFKTSDENATPFQTVNNGENSSSVADGSIALFNVTVGDTSASITDSEASKASDEHVWYKVTISDGSTWVYDPELINTGTGDAKRGYQALSPGDGAQTLP